MAKYALRIVFEERLVNFKYDVECEVDSAKDMRHNMLEVARDKDYASVVVEGVTPSPVTIRLNEKGRQRLRELTIALDR